MATDQKQHGFYVPSRQRDNCQTLLRTKNTIFPVIIFKKNIQAHWLFLNVFTWSDDILSCEETKLLMLGLKNLAISDWHNSR